MKRSGWYMLPSGVVYFGSQPPRGVPCDPPDATPAPTPEPSVPERPDAKAKLGELIAYVDAHNLDADGVPSTERRTKAQLWALIEAAEQPVDTADSGDQIDADVLVDESVADGEQVGTADEATPDADGQQVDVEIAQEDQR